ncbi:RNA chaperone ProQ [Aliivibrio fischeri]|uniref:RNA chaperone ProQ n=4 Tax=Aliivibrio fischeri TaxID=668 RepID=PROQ_ALIF1|nr:RNA chaperone ProQ [Aliivibrio fischeri]B5FE11.1 RecName: Full=RNA chaperone ProQ [Aliivibrio fischeri MJ11]Q5E5C2.1 RecName: Full=RNA chaperone ProQ [Aliivibrio fischeri ES114]AAW85774.1 predicted structural transport element [Aliivibrio fischeri ES114]ACH65804.1 ProP effector [Aliivibrio fischeri MJ11]EHN69692.1 ProP expression regulator [Aliivibrio fischeri SR5]KLU79959.1 prop expression regulator [Aliivibrio fischeri]MBP3141841.1 RNA chaperone ProQ [Aliivibrio fischeri]
MENSEKLANSKEVIAYIAERFPKCFILEGEAKPLKIGIFQDLAERLSDDPKVSKTQLRAGLRQYTSSWRYLHGVKPGASRVDLDGNPCGELEEEHIEHAKATLEESKAKVATRRKEQAKKAREEAKAKKTARAATPPKRRPQPAAKKVEQPVETRALNADEITVGNNVSVNMGKGNMPATIVEINKDDVRIRLSNGLQMVVKAENLRS